MESPAQSDLGGLQDQDSDTETMDTLDSQANAGRDQVCQPWGHSVRYSLHPSCFQPTCSFLLWKVAEKFFMICRMRLAVGSLTACQTKVR